jgi:copper homeostasis protein
MPKVLLEICCGSIDDALYAQAGGADRVELCSALFLGGLTPSFGTLRYARQHLRIPIVAMVRPRGGGFCYTGAEFATMEADAQAAIDAGADGLVFGILTADGEIDIQRTNRLCALAAGRQSVFHRAFDVTPDPFRALDQLVDLGITRVLTSGQQDSVPEGAELIRRLIDHARGRIEVLPGGGIKPWNLADVLARTGCSQVHLTAFRTALDTSTRRRPHVTFGGALYPTEDSFSVADPELVRDISNRLKKSC